MNKIQEILHKKRNETEEHIKKLQAEGKEGIRYTAMLPDIPFFILALLCDVGWLIHLIAGIIYFCVNGFHNALDWISLVALTAVILGVAFTMYMNKIHEKEIATRLQKNLSFGLTVYAGLGGSVIGILQFAIYHDISSLIICMTVGGMINFVTGFPIYLSFKKGIFYGIH